jgi:hypothetical protein
MTDQDFAQRDRDATSYSYRPSAFGAPRSFRLLQDALEWDTGRRSGRIALDGIAQVRLSYRPATMQTRRFLMEIWSPNAPRQVVYSSSWKSMVEQAALDNEYRAFVLALHQRLADVGTAARFAAGLHPLIYWPGLLVSLAGSIGMAGLIVRAIDAGAMLGAALIAVFLLMFLWQLGNIFYRNRPRTYRPDALPWFLLPSPR